VTFDGPQSMSQHFDPADLLPAGARERLEKLRLRSAEAHALVPRFEEISDLNTERIKSEQRLERLVGHPSTGGFGLKPDDARVLAETKQVKKLTGDVERLSRRSKERAESWRAASGALQNIEQWLRHGKPHGTVLQEYEGPEPKLHRGESGLLDAIENRRRRARELKADLARIAAAPFPSSYCKQRMREQIEQLARRGAPDVTLIVEHDGKLTWPMQRVQSQVFNAQPGATAFAEVPDAVALVAWTFKGALIAALDAEIDAAADDPASLSSEDRQQREAEVISDILANDRDESWLTWRAMDERLPVEFRADCSPAAILSVQVVTVPRAATLPGSSVEHAMLSITEGR
jgi:hypothetical protein